VQKSQNGRLSGFTYSNISSRLKKAEGGLFKPMCASCWTRIRESELTKDCVLPQVLAVREFQCPIDPDWTAKGRAILASYITREAQCTTATARRKELTIPYRVEDAREEGDGEPDREPSASQVCAMGTPEEVEDEGDDDRSVLRSLYQQKEQ
jgi:hypothetical protein